MIAKQSVNARSEKPFWRRQGMHRRAAEESHGVFAKLNESFVPVNMLRAVKWL